MLTFCKLTAWPLIFQVVLLNLHVDTQMSGLTFTFVTAVEVAGYLQEP